jgi:SAM-dependent methyltransferase
MTSDQRELYTPGHTGSAIAFMAGRSAETHARFFLPHLTAGMTLLDVGCGPGSITVGLAAAVAPGAVIGVDQGADQLDEAGNRARSAGVRNVQFRAASCYDLPLTDHSVDRVFSHALLEHLSDPARALAEIRRVLRPGGMVGLCCPDWGGFLLAPHSTALDSALDAYRQLQESNGGDPYIGRKLGGYLAAEGFSQVRMDARYERYSSASHIASYLAIQLDAASQSTHARTLNEWASEPTAMFAQAWVSATATSPA